MAWDKYRYVLIDEFQDINKMQYENNKNVNNSEK